MSHASVDANKEDGLTLAIIGCGTLGGAILSGILASLSSLSDNPSSTKQSDSSVPAGETPTRLPNRFVACVRRPESGDKLRKAFSDHLDVVNICVNDNLRAIENADVVLLGCKPYMYRDILGHHDIRPALSGKLVISILAGVPAEEISAFVNEEASAKSEPCRVIRAMPNTASAVRESMTVVAAEQTSGRDEQLSLVKWIFNRIGKVAVLPPKLMDVSTALCGSGPAFVALMLEAMADGAVAMGLPRAEAQTMAAQVMRGTSGIVLGGEHPAILRDKVSTPGGCTIGGLLKLEEGAVRGTISKAVREATVVASQLGKGVQGVNGTRWPGS